MDFELLTKAEAAERARCTSRFLQMQIAKGAGPAVTRLGRKVLVRSDALQNWIERCTEQRWLASSRHRFGFCK